MYKYLPILLLLLVACKNEQTEVKTTDSTTVTTQDPQVIPHETIDPAPVDSASVSQPDTIALEKGAQLKPVDNADKEKGFLAFRGQLLSAVRAKDGNAVISMLDTNIHLSFGGHGGIADFKTMWKPQDKNSPLWKKLEWVLVHGGDFRREDPRTFWAPYVYSNWPERGPDPFEFAAITGSNVPVYAKADSTSQVISRLSYHLVKGVDGSHIRENPTPFAKVQTPSGKVGFVRSDLVRSSIDYRAAFDKRSGKWKMSVFIAGD